MRVFRNTGCGSAMIVSALLLGCIEIVEPAPPALERGTESGQEVPATCSCSPDDIIGQTYRFTELTVDKPESLAADLDGQWASEIENYLLNVIFRVNSAAQDTGSPSQFSTINLTAGPGWRTPGSPYQVTPEFEPTSYCLVDEALNLTTEVTPQGGAQCTFTNEAPSNLFFHLGPKTDPLMCAPLLTPQNTTPIMDLTVSFGFNDDCSAITRGHLTGCIPQADADRICVCLVAGNCSKAGADPAAEFPEWQKTSELAGYCSSACGAPLDGTGWATFRGMLQGKSVAPECTVNGQPGYLLEANFEAAAIPPEKFNPVISGDCLGAATK